jgi:hypothetical protein
MKLRHKCRLNTRNKFSKDVFFSNPKISLSILDELKELGYGEKSGEISEIKEARVMNSLQP